MKINPLINYNNLFTLKSSNLSKENLNNKKFISNSLKPLTKDSVNFGAAMVDYPETVKEAMELGMSIYENEIKKTKDTKQIINTKAPDVEVLPREKLAEIMKPEEVQNYAAYFEECLGRNFTSYGYRMFIDDKSSKDKNTALFKAMEISHEYTHYLQAKQGRDVKFLKGISDEWEYFGSLMALSSIVFQKFDKELQAYTMYPVFDNAQDGESIAKYNRFLPYKRKITKEDILNMNKYSSEETFQKKVNKIFDVEFKKMINEIPKIPSKSMDPIIKAVVAQMVNEGREEELKEDLRKYCALNAQKEKEAYMTESAVAKEIIKTRKPINLDAFVLYYDMLQNAFEKQI